MNSQKKGSFVISIDFEYAIGYADVELSEGQKNLVRQEAKVSKQILGLFEKYDIPATWAIVGHLLEDDCSVRDGKVHSNFPSEIYTDSKLDWFAHHPPAGDVSNPLWFDSAGVIELIQSSSIKHEVASHSYAHILYGHPTIKPEAIETDLLEVKKIHTKHNLPLVSFIFPRNMEGYHAQLKDAGFICYRGESKFWYHKIPGPLGRLARLLDYFIPSCRTVVPTRHKSGLINIPDSLLLLGRNGLRKLIAPSVMKRKIRSGLKQAAERQEIFHLWFHPSNFSYDTATQLEILEDTLTYVTELRNNGALEVLTMQAIAEKM